METLWAPDLVPAGALGGANNVTLPVIIITDWLPHIAVAALISMILFHRWDSGRGSHIQRRRRRVPTYDEYYNNHPFKEPLDWQRKNRL